MTVTTLDYLADLSKFDVPAVIAAMDGAPQAVGAPDNTETYLIVEGAPRAVAWSCRYIPPPRAPAS